MARKPLNPSEEFLDHIVTMIKNLLMDNVNYTNGYYHGLKFPHNGIDEMIRDTKDRAKHILDHIEATKHLIEELPAGVIELKVPVIPGKKGS